MTGQDPGSSGDAVAEASWDVELPDESSEPLSGDRPAEASMSVAYPAAFGCEPDGCEDWRARLGRGGVVVAGDQIVNAGASDVMSIDIVTGATRWSWRYAELGVPPIVEGARPHLLDADRFAVTFADGGIQLRDLGTGHRSWHVDLDLDHIDEVAAHGDVIVVAGWGRLAREVHVIALVAASGEQRWRLRVDRAVSVQTDPLLLMPEGRDELSGIDPTTGQDRWARPAPGPLSALPGEPAHALVSPAGVEAIDPATGETVLHLPRPVTNAGPTRMVGRLLLTNLPITGGQGPHRTEVQVGDVVSGETSTLPNVTGVAAVGDTLVIVQHEGTDLTLQGLADDGSLRWLRELTTPDDICCWVAEPGPDDGTALIIPPDLAREPVRAVAAATGDTVTSFRHLRHLARAQLDWASGVGVARDDDGVLFIGPAGSIGAPSTARILTVSPRPVLQVEPGRHVEPGLLGVDPAILVGAPAAAAPVARPDAAIRD